MEKELANFEYLPLCKDTDIGQKVQKLAGGRLNNDDNFVLGNSISLVL